MGAVSASAQTLLSRPLIGNGANATTPGGNGGGGEPTIHKQLLEFVDAAQARPVKTVIINTNGIRPGTYRTEGPSNPLILVFGRVSELSTCSWSTHSAAPAPAVKV